MKNLALLTLFVLQTFTIVAQQNTYVKIVSQDAEKIILDIQIPQASYKKVDTKNGEAVLPIIPNATSWQLVGAPDVLKLNVGLAIPNAANTTISILESKFTEIQNILVAPSKGKITRPTNPQSIEYQFGSYYNNNKFFPEQIASLNTPYILRNQRGQSLNISTMQYNGATRSLRLYNSMRLQINFSGTNNVNALNEEAQKNASPIFNEIFKNHFINGVEPNPTGSNYTKINDKGSMLVLAPQKYITHIAPFIEWKNQKGISTKLVDIDTLAAGVSEAAIKNFVANYYNANGNTFLLMVGNSVDVPTRNEFYTDTFLHGPGDNAYGYINGADHYPEIIVGRLMARDSNDIKIQVQKIIAYEKTPNMQSNWMRNITGIASSQGTGDDNQYDFEHERDICDSMVNQFTYLQKFELYDGDHGGADSNGNPSAFSLVNIINNAGTGIINYTGHGDNYGITTCGFNTGTHIPTLKNTNAKFPFMVTVGCRPGNFIVGSCLAASGAWAKDATTGNGAGFIASAMSTVDQYWNEPMQAQDEINAIIRGARPSNIKYTIGGICVDGFASMNDQYNIPTDPTGGSDMTDTWEIFGDPSVELLTKNDGAISCTYEPLININATTFTVSANANGASATLYYNNKIIDSKVIVGGSATFNIPASTMVLFQNMYVTITQHNMTPCHSAVQIVNYATSIANTNNVNLSIYPNPVSDKLMVDADTKKMQSLKIIDLQGKVLWQIADINTSKYFVPTANLANGIYVLQVVVDGIAKKYKFTK